MHFQLLTRDKRIDYDIWQGRHQFYYARIEKPYKKDHPDYKLYTFKIRKPCGEVLTSELLNQSFTNLEDCRDFIFKWIKKDLKSLKTKAL